MHNKYVVKLIYSKLFLFLNIFFFIYFHLFYCLVLIYFSILFLLSKKNFTNFHKINTSLCYETFFTSYKKDSLRFYFLQVIREKRE